jgi:hypothetical protein
MQPRIPTPATGYSNMIPSGLPFAVIQRALIEARDPAQGTRLVEDVNAEADVPDGKGLARTCSRPTIKSILKSVR